MGGPSDADVIDGRRSSYGIPQIQPSSSRNLSALSRKENNSPSVSALEELSARELRPHGLACFQRSVKGKRRGSLLSAGTDPGISCVTGTWLRGWQEKEPLLCRTWITREAAHGGEVASEGTHPSRGCCINVR